MKALTALMKYFNEKDMPGRLPIADFKAEVDALSDEDKRELGELACIELGVKFDE